MHTTLIFVFINLIFFGANNTTDYEFNLSHFALCTYLIINYTFNKEEEEEEKREEDGKYDINEYVM